MTDGVLQGVSIRGVRACVPAHSRGIDDLIPDEAERARLTGSIGVLSRRIAPAGVLTSDLCSRAAENLLADLGWAKDSIDVLILVTQNPDYVIPATACVLQTRLGLGNCLAFDINLGCSGYTYGLWTAASLLKTFTVAGRPARALLLAGDVSSARLLPDDRSTVPLFGDAGSATALEIDAEADDIYGVFGTDGSGAPHILIEAGGTKMPLMPPKEPLSPEDAEKLYKAARLHLNGAEVFNFTLKAVPPLMKAILERSQATVDDIDYVLFHQANAFMLNHLRKKSGLPEAKVPVAMESYGNTSSASIPLTLCASLADVLDAPKQVVMMGFGVGWSWGALKLTLNPAVRPVIDEYT
ncbi:ketoacyl-ACP synthase III [Asticcacaulis sp. YBE204]|uniref:ketoacyl-ACP synthase III n=1 Tax=Asticcacaulis sp. YBE204 TaxID=1282363 RepID=UPI0003C3F8C7|nr:ketoacyl-ACP synthase III [Asticcacaulis sp. YBE204]ESQ81162.1 hypothetical protein AEYBE204_02170 [Asticcacaulis sp. YBE204]